MIVLPARALYPTTGRLLCLAANFSSCIGSSSSSLVVEDMDHKVYVGTTGRK